MGKSKLNKGLFSSNTSEWGTPQKLFDELNDEFHFTLDPCCSEESKKCEKYFTDKDDGLTQDWSNDIVFMNPPYGNVISQWAEKAHNESLRGSTVVGLLPARVDTRWFHNFIYHKAEIRFIKGRLKFERFGENKPCKYFNSAAPFPSMIVVWTNKETNE